MDWVTLNNELDGCTEKQAEKLMRKEIEGKCRKVFVLRIHSRYNRLRAAREREELARKWR